MDILSQHFPLLSILKREFAGYNATLTPAWHWHEIRQIFGRRFKSAMFAFVTTMLATVALDLTQAIIIGVGLSALIFVFQISRGKVVKMPVLAEKMRAAGYEMRCDPSHILVVYVIGPLFFGTANTFSHAMENLNGAQDVVLSLRTVPLLDTTGISVLETFIERLEANGGKVYLSGLNDPVHRYLERAGIIQHLGEDHLFWSGDQAIIAADRYRASVTAQSEEEYLLHPAPV